MEVEDDLSWMASAACASDKHVRPEFADTPVYDLFYAEVGTPESREAIRICVQECAHRESCLQYADDRHDEFGVWGGETSKERTRRRRRRNAAANRSRVLQ